MVLFIYPSLINNPSSIINPSLTRRRETFTMWMKSLVFHGNGCTVFNSRGEVAFRVDNYQQKCCRKVFLMDSYGNILFSLNRKVRTLTKWEFLDVGRDSNGSNRSVETRNSRIFNITSCYLMTGFEGKSTLKIIDFSGRLLLAEFNKLQAMQKQSIEGIALGDDVLALMVEPHADQSLVMALVTVYGLINNKL
ncbi:PREDICTED: protein LURP-one-related 11-like [Erythranthe guttata]|uniref:protein LURP-one-related 11-like n=1 Tax=Erythranthe guttata TaxID=4155 RepID=UPI00064DD62A|nr:PREDICTED: protein LURP-one-related 11-like [Erythranthe guttata]|eukprot:XP_012836242.1 PREDICTED: protein LURP-one-related 11-like [Erythranthe guttata]